MFAIVTPPEQSAALIVVDWSLGATQGAGGVCSCTLYAPGSRLVNVMLFDVSPALIVITLPVLGVGPLTSNLNV